MRTVAGVNRQDCSMKRVGLEISMVWTSRYQCNHLSMHSGMASTQHNAAAAVILPWCFIVCGQYITCSSGHSPFTVLLLCCI